MDSEKTRGLILKTVGSPLMEGDNVLSRRVLSRNFSVGCSSRICYARPPEGVPFQWEMRPGTPKRLPKEENMPPLSPPPALVSLGLPKPCISDEPKESTKSRFKFWKKIKIYRRRDDNEDRWGRHRNANNTGGHHGLTNNSNNKVEGFEFGSFDGDLTVSPCESSSSSFASLSLAFGPPMEPTMQCPDEDDRSSDEPVAPRTCSPWNFHALLIYVAKQI